MTDEVKFALWKGQISGYLSALLGILSLGGVLCFLFPQQLTSEQFRAAYSVDFARSLLFVCLVIAYVMGVLSYVLNRSKRLAWIGICTSLLASILGGSRIEVQAFESTPFSFGVDWLAISFLFSMLIFIPIERAFTLNKEQVILRRGWRTDLAYFAVSHLLIQYIFLFVNYFSVEAFSWATIPGFQDRIRALPIPVQFLLATFVADLFQYITHRFHHQVGFLWKFHSIHHSSHCMDWLAGSRTHLVEIFFTRALVMVPLYLCGFVESALNAYVILVGVQAVAIHANVNWDFGWLRYIIATPQFHHWHHSKDRQYMDANYAVHLPIIDILFGTFRCPRRAWPDEYGVVSNAPPETFWAQMWHPFRRNVPDEDDSDT